ncbi:MAG: matrixin family metalloprotease [Fimbriimonadaceae bacterium]|nr:matrixin family metalloprotease [Fimbriimonadaceae bacterium]
MHLIACGQIKRALLCVALAGTTVFGAARDGDLLRGPGFLPDLQTHLNRANDNLKVNDFQGAMAQSDAILLNSDVKVYFDLATAPAYKQAQLREIFFDGADMWAPVIQNTVRFIETDRRSDADVVVGFRGNVQGYAAQVGGHATWRRIVRKLDDGSYDVEFKANISIRTVAPNGQAMNVAQMRHISAHEIGHILGLNDSDQIGDVMGPLVLNRPATKVSSRELDSLRKLRNEAMDIRRRSLSGWVLGFDRYTL